MSIISEALTKHAATLIFLHGLGDTGHGWCSEIESIKPSYMKIVCPTAKRRRVSLNAGAIMPAWFDLYALDASGPEDSDGIKSAAEEIHELIKSEVTDDVPENRIIVGGFSQGAALALYSALTYDTPLCGVIALSGWLPLHKDFPGALQNSKSIPIYQAHGDNDNIVDVQFGDLTSSLLKSFMKKIEYKTFTGLGHHSNDEEMQQVKQKLEKWTK